MFDASRDLTDPPDDCEWLPARELFRRRGFEPAPPGDVDDSQLRARLWEFIYALAGRRFYLCYTDHLSDRCLYTWLHDEWFEEEVPDVPSETEWECTLDMTDFNNGTDPIIWLQYFATEEQRLEFAKRHSLQCLPAHEDPQFDRDRWLPEPPSTGLPPADLAEDEALFEDEADEDEPDGDYDESDPLGLAKVDREIAAEKERRQMLEPAGNEILEDDGSQTDLSLERSHLFVPPVELTDETLTVKLWDLLHELACRGFYVLNTDHLSDRELYTELWSHGLCDGVLLPGKCSYSGWFHDCIGSGSEEHIHLWLRYYADEEDRAEHARDWPDDPIPPSEKPPFNRDWRLPKGPF